MMHRMTSFVVTAVIATVALGIQPASADVSQSVTGTYSWSGGRPALWAKVTPGMQAKLRLQVQSGGEWTTIRVVLSSSTGRYLFKNLYFRPYRIVAVARSGYAQGYSPGYDLTSHWKDGWSSLSSASTSGIAVAGHGWGHNFQAGTTYGAVWSTWKVPLSIAALRYGGSTYDVSRAILFSDNAAAERLWKNLGSNREYRVEHEFRLGGDQRTQIYMQHPGVSNMYLSDQARYAANLPCRSGTSYVRDLMWRSNQHYSYGIGTTSWHDAVAAKIGYGPRDGGLFMRQIAYVKAGDGRIWGISIVTQGADKPADEWRLKQIAAWIAPRLISIPSGKC